MKKCTRCNRELEPSRFFKGANKDGKRSWCKSCVGDYYQRNKRKQRDRFLRKTFGISLAEFELLSFEQQGRCKICLEIPSVLNVDHSHATGEVRGLLCSGCNTGLGFFKDSPSRLLAAIEYLRQMETPQH